MENIESSQFGNNAEIDTGPELLEPYFSHDMAQWIDGIDLETMMPKPFDLELEDFYTQSELDSVLNGKTEEERAEIIRNNHNILLRNNEKIKQLDDHIVELSELSKTELETLYHDESISDSDKSIISCVGIIRTAYEDGLGSLDDADLLRNVFKATQDIYGFNIIWTREILKNSDSHFRILTKKEREEVSPGSIEDIASAALESFVMNPNFSNDRILDYDNYLHGIMLDCTKRRVKKENGINLIEEEVDSEEFQERVIESMSWALIDDESKNKEYSREEFERLIEQSADLFANYKSGHHYRNDFEEYDGNVRLAGQDNPENIYGFNYPDRVDSFWNCFEDKIRSNNDEVFKYNIELANTEMKQWAAKIDLDEIERINNDNELDYEQKLTSITLCVQRALGVLNLDDDGRSHPIVVKWFRPQEPELKKFIRKLFNIPIENEELPEECGSAFYRYSERSIYFQKESKPEQKLSDWVISTVAHEMWHAKQHELEDIEQGDAYLVNGNLKARMYYKNDLAYSDYAKDNGGYYSQIMEREAYALEGHIAEALTKRRKKERGKKIINIFFGL